ncbi:CCA tRNA nucleotidyltransferase [Novosphingobium sp.]|uniref:CCA tRNA nucleotidyltransferase n=1 Tax=Novosphingobium sp. TaxID=1874826 RepID=UPI0022C2876F|nr:CCA tRNA nucleotidyltransferase [Novosphingobium sp.]MCZ8019626.1 CCA tRNA nucleotidyltransferase [Novosphingobium sp.]MCZ8035441.1 CCA tRNA nucleotidyltransferase [Novosphingobium sp.]MCZ8050755.1 CCA tRNA nucleotidyltransferase [Novosphingobium sp.]MCZ8059101.1 CCA tRNA nucleotidyltransferase [Novosphingobium sp.]MCZ8232547.1 CCA tRNA nucleotidyltransferase [Novosphingobium sp.]
MSVSLPAADWTRREDLARLVAVLGPDKARYVGGAVRDTLLGIPVKDVDIATPLLPLKVIGKLKDAGIQAVPTGIEHGTVTAVLPEGPVEITTLRHDVSTDGRRATVAFANDWQDDAARRDFTINALYADPATGEVFDWFGGLADLAARRVRFIGDPHQRIREDHLRILRYFRFQARFGSQPADEQSESACAELAATLKGLSRERVGMEMMNLLGLVDPAPTVARMAELSVLPVVLPEADVAALVALVAAETRQQVPPDALRRLAALLPADVPLAEAVASRFRLSGVQKKRLALAAGRDGAPGDPRALAYRLGKAAALDRLLLGGGEVAPLADWAIPVFPLKGGDIVARGVKAGPDVARTLRAVESAWIAAGFDDAAVPGLLDAELAARG